MWCVCIYIYIFVAFYLLLKYCIDGPMLVINYRNMKLFLNKGSCVLTDSKQYVYKQCTKRKGSAAFSLSLCIQCVEYIDRNTLYRVSQEERT